MTKTAFQKKKKRTLKIKKNKGKKRALKKLNPFFLKKKRGREKKKSGLDCGGKKVDANRPHLFFESCGRFLIFLIKVWVLPASPFSVVFQFQINWIGFGSGEEH